MCSFCKVPFSGDPEIFERAPTCRPKPESTTLDGQSNCTFVTVWRTTRFKENVQSYFLLARLQTIIIHHHKSLMCSSKYAVLCWFTNDWVTLAPASHSINWWSHLRYLSFCHRPLLFINDTIMADVYSSGLIMQHKLLMVAESKDRFQSKERGRGDSKGQDLILVLIFCAAL